MTDLIDKKCVPCEGGTLPFTREEAERYLAEVPGWELRDDEHKITKTFSFKNFAEAIAFVNRVAALAEAEGHHPDIRLFSYKKVEITLSTHAIGGLSENDFIMAAKVGDVSMG